MLVQPYFFIVKKLVDTSYVSYFNMSMNLRKINFQCGEYRSRTDDLLRARQAL